MASERCRYSVAGAASIYTDGRLATLRMRTQSRAAALSAACPRGDDEVRQEVLPFLVCHSAAELALSRWQALPCDALEEGGVLRGALSAERRKAW